MDQKKIKQFRKTVWNFYKKNKRSFPWREPIRHGSSTEAHSKSSGQAYNPYHILVSEVMLQQTQADRVVGYYKKWLRRFPTPQILSKASFSEIYPLWQGLGYNRRAMALKKLAQMVVEKYDGMLPKSLELLEELPGIGPYTARAVSIFSYNRPLACLETNIRRVFIHHFFQEAEVVSDQDILPLLQEALPQKKSREWHWALMDYGAYLKNKVENPNRRHKQYAIQSKFEGSRRQIRGAILQNLAKEKMTVAQLASTTKKDIEKVSQVIEILLKEGLIKQNKKDFFLS